MNGQRVKVQSHNIRTDRGLQLYDHGEGMLSLSVPLDGWLRTRFTQIQNFVVSNVTIPPDVVRAADGNCIFKPFLDADTLLVPMSQWCKYYKYDEEKTAYVEVAGYVPFEKGDFNVGIDVSHVYIGPHKGGHQFSLSLRVYQIVYREELSSFDAFIFDSLPEQAVVDEKKKRKRNTKAKALKE